MKAIQIGRTPVICKDYECSQDEVYPEKKHLRLWLYVNLTDGCPACCPFCVYAETARNRGMNIVNFAQVLTKISPYVSGISLTGGEPMLHIPLLEQVIHVIRETVDPNIELDMVTNGMNIRRLPGLKGLERFATIHVSRHAMGDETNARLMCWKDAPSKALLKEVFADLPDPGATVLNCVLQKKGVKDMNTVCDYLEMAADIHAANVSFIGMFKVNDYCRENYVSPAEIDCAADARFTVWNQFHDHGFCRCSAGDYLSKTGYVRYYVRCPGNIPAPDYCRQLVYGTDDLLRSGFGDADIIDV